MGETKIWNLRHLLGMLDEQFFMNKYNSYFIYYWNNPLELHQINNVIMQQYLFKLNRKGPAICLLVSGDQILNNLKISLFP